MTYDEVEQDELEPVDEAPAEDSLIAGRKVAPVSVTTADEPHDDPQRPREVW